MWSAVTETVTGRGDDESSARAAASASQPHAASQRSVRRHPVAVNMGILAASIRGHRLHQKKRVDEAWASSSTRCVRAAVTALPTLL